MNVKDFGCSGAIQSNRGIGRENACEFQKKTHITTMRLSTKELVNE